MDIVISVASIIWGAYQVFCVIFTTLFLIAFYKNYKKVKKVNEVLEQAKEILGTVKFVNVETVSNTMYMYDAKTNSFICQADTEDELWETAKKKFPDVALMLDKKIEG